MSSRIWQLLAAGVAVLVLVGSFPPDRSARKVAAGPSPATTSTVAPIPSASPSPITAIVGIPVQLEISTINVRTHVEEKDTIDGAIPTPDYDKPQDVVWWDASVQPGEPGLAVIAGHLDWYGGISGPFAGLATLRDGDTISVVDNAGLTREFTVDLKEIVDYPGEPTWFANGDKPQIVLITCAGEWSDRLNTYNQRLYVRATLAPVKGPLSAS